jgi:hypothetical protein
MKPQIGWFVNGFLITMVHPPILKNWNGTSSINEGFNGKINYKWDMYGYESFPYLIAMVYLIITDRLHVLNRCCHLLRLPR